MISFRGTMMSLTVTFSRSRMLISMSLCRLVIRADSRTTVRSSPALRRSSAAGRHANERPDNRVASRIDQPHQGTG